MLSSPAGSALSGNGSASAGAAAHGSVVLSGGLRTGLARAAQTVNTGGPFPGAAGRVGDSTGMLGGSGPGISSRPGVRPGNGSGLSALQVATNVNPSVGGGLGVMSARFDRDKEIVVPQVCSASDADSESGDDDEPTGSSGSSRRGVKRERAEMEGAGIGQEAGAPPGGYGVLSGGVAGAKPGKKTRGRVKIKMEFIDNKLRRYTTFSKRKTGIMKKAYELSTLTGTQVLLLVASETGHVYTFATRKLQPMITSETGKALIQTCLNSPDSPPRSDPSTDQRMSATGFEETDLTYQVSESESLGETKDTLKPAFTVASLPGSTSAQATVPTTSTTMQVSSGPSFPITNYLAPVSGGNSSSASGSPISNTNGTVLKSAAATGGVMQLPGGFTFMSGQLQQHSLALQGQQGQTLTTATVTATQTPQAQQAVFRLPAAVSLAGGAMPQQLQAIQVQPSTQSSSINTDSSSPEISQTSTASTATVSLPATIVTSSVPTSVAGHMMYPSPHAVMYASAPTLTDGGLAVLNAFSQGASAMQVSHTQTSDTGAVPQVFLTAPSGTVQIPVSAVQLHPMVIGQQSSGSNSNLTELQVVNLDATQSSKND
ncbi:Serum response factor [Bagarius yarrelli]|uniref:Serum response factor n=1 Tax=Bagarius yarrelli TaxID=175774 RepID=A0A556TMR3_BAGYA|nr:Serum response factor [Bagarius yarrelli]